MLYLALLLLVFRGKDTVVDGACKGSNTNNGTFSDANIDSTSNTTDVTTTTKQGIPQVTPSGKFITICSAELEGRIPHRFQSLDGPTGETTSYPNTTLKLDNSTYCSYHCLTTSCVFGYFDTLTKTCYMFSDVKYAYFETNPSMVAVFKLYMPGNILCNKSLIGTVMSNKQGLRKALYKPYGMYYIYDNSYNTDVVYAFYPEVTTSTTPAK